MSPWVSHLWHHSERSPVTGRVLSRERHMRRKLLVLLAFVGFVVGFGCADTAPPADRADDPPVTGASAAESRANFVGNWELVRVERVGADGEFLPPPEPPSFGSGGAVGYIMYDSAGYMGVVIMQAGRQPYAGDMPTPGEAAAALRSYTSYFGTFTVNEAEGYVTHHLQGNVRPPAAANDNKRFYEFSGNQLILKPPAGDSGVQLRIVWERVPELPDSDLTLTHRRLFGFYRIASVERRTLDGEALTAEQYDDGFIIYMPSGHMAVHLMRPNRPVYTGAPTPEEALGAMRTYVSYFGPFSVHEDEGYLVHHRVGATNPGSAGTDAQRFYELNDTTLTLRPPARTVDGREVQRTIRWERISNE